MKGRRNEIRPRLTSCHLRRFSQTESHKRKREFAKASVVDALKFSRGAFCVKLGAGHRRVIARPRLLVRSEPSPRDLLSRTHVSRWRWLLFSRASPRLRASPAPISRAVEQSEEKEPSSCGRVADGATPTAGFRSWTRRATGPFARMTTATRRRTSRSRNCASVRTGSSERCARDGHPPPLRESSFVFRPSRETSSLPRDASDSDPRSPARSFRARRRNTTRRTRRSAAPTATTGATTTSSGAGRVSWARARAARAPR